MIGPSATTRCPRCGYDMRATMATWTTACPLECRCVECGLTFEWADLLSERRRYPRWSVEHARSRWSVAWIAFGTMLMSAIPWRFWSSLKMVHEIRGRRLVAYLAWLAAVVYLAFVSQIVHGVVMEVVHNGLPVTRAVTSGAYAAVLPLSDQPPGWYVVTPATPATPRPPVVYPGPDGQVIQLTLPLLPGTPAQPSPPRAYAGRFLSGPLSVSSVRAIPLGLSTPTWWSGGFPIIVCLVLFYATLLVTTPLGLIALPVSRRRAKVRAAHIIRITVYSLVFLPVFLVFLLFQLGSRSWDGLVDECRFVGTWVLPAFVFVWWWCAIGRYLKIPHAPGVALAILIIGIMIGPVLVLIGMTTGAMLGWWS